MALFDKLKNAAKDAASIAKGIASSAAKDLAKMGNSPEAQAARDAAKQAEYARIREEMAAKEQAKKELMERIVNGDPNNERWDFLESATDAEIAELDAMEAAKEEQDYQKRKQARIDSAYAQKLLEENCACNMIPGAGWYCTTCKGQFISNCGDGMLCETKRTHEEAGDFDELMFPDSLEFMARFSALEEGGPAAKKDRDGDVGREFMEKYLPVIAKSCCISGVLDNGIGKKNYKLEFLTHLDHVPEEMTTSHWGKLFAALREPPVEEAAAQAYYEKMTKLLDMPSLYERSENTDIWDEELQTYTFDRDFYREFHYKIGVFSAIYNPDILPTYYEYTSVVDPQELFTEDGKIKPSGIYQKDASDYDTIYGVLEYWKAKSEKMAARNG